VGLQEGAAEHRSGSSDVLRANVGAAGERIAGQASFFDAAAGSFRKRSAGARYHWHLRRDGIPRQSRNSRIGDSHRTGRFATQHPESGCPAGNGARLFRRDDWFGGSFPVYAADSKPAVRRGSDGSNYFRWDCLVARDDRIARQLHSSATRRSNRSPDVAALRLAEALMRPRPSFPTLINRSDSCFGMGVTIWLYRVPPSPLDLWESWS